MSRGSSPATIGSALRSLARDEEGVSAIIFALLAVPICGMIALGIDYHRASNLKGELQTSADSTALAAVIAASKGASNSDAVSTAVAFWTSNTQRLAKPGSNITAPTVTLQNVNGVATAHIDYVATFQSPFGATIGVPQFTVGGKSAAQAYKSTAANNGLNGTGTLWGDPHVNGADGKSFVVHCPAGNWYDLLSDSGIEVNIACFHSTYYNEDMENQVSVVLGSHVVGFSRPPLDNSFNPVTSFDAGTFVLDGVTQTVPRGTTGLFLGGTVTYAHVTDAWNNSYANQLSISTPVYKMTISYGSNGGYVGITATGAGLCEVPGGAWGQTLAGNDDTNQADYQVGGPTATDFAFSRPACAAGTFEAHLIQ